MALVAGVALVAALAALGTSNAPWGLAVAPSATGRLPALALALAVVGRGLLSDSGRRFGVG